ncbi:hypothetical protein AB4454_03410 [Vibrio artabrorum]|uniref:hypothetical protein n=1 Tax=Vibrio artabrorum TaxID=446374 RepID=UPI00354C8C79
MDGRFVVNCLYCGGELSGCFIELGTDGNYVVNCRCGDHQIFFGCTGAIGCDGFKFIARL